MEKIKYLIVGGGITGLTFANFHSSDDYLIIEKENEIGGYCRTIYEKGFIWDYAGHFFHFSTDILKKYFNEKIDKSEVITRNKVTNIYFEDRYIDFPFQKNIHQLPKQLFLDCLYDLFSKKEKDNYDSFEDMLFGKFGASITNLFLKPYNEKLYACDLNKLDQDAMSRFFPYADKEEIILNIKDSKNSSYNTNFMYPKNGAKTYVNAIASEIDSNKISINEQLIKVDVENKFVQTNKRKIKFEYLINTIPLDSFLEKSDYKLKNSIDPLTYNKVLVFNLGFNKSANQLLDTHWTYVPQLEINFYRIGFYNHILGHEKLSMYVEVGFDSKKGIDIEDQFNKTILNLKKMHIIDDTHILEAHKSLVLSPAYVHVSTESEKCKKTAIDYLNKNNIFSIGRYGDWKYCSIEDSMIDAINLSKKI